MEKLTSITIRSCQDLEQLLLKHKISLLPSYHSLIKIELSDLSEEENSKWSKIINSSYYACGCGEGTIFLLAAMVIYLVTWITVFNFRVSLSHVLIGIVFLLFMSILGKALGMLLGKMRLMNAGRKLIKKTK